MKLKDVYITFDLKTKKVEVIPKSDGKPIGKHVQDPCDYKLNNLALFFLEMFTGLTCSDDGPFKANPRQVYEAFSEIEEFDDLDDVDLLKPSARKRIVERERKLLWSGATILQALTHQG